MLNKRQHKQILSESLICISLNTNALKHRLYDMFCDIATHSDINAVINERANMSFKTVQKRHNALMRLRYGV